jgi:hypothetical protein
VDVGNGEPDLGEGQNEPAGNADEGGYNGVWPPSEHPEGGGQADTGENGDGGQQPPNRKDQEAQTEVHEVTDQTQDLTFDEQNPMPAEATRAEQTALWRLLQRRNNFLRAAEPDLRGARDVEYKYYMMVSEVEERLKDEAAIECIAMAAAIEDVE